MFLNPGQTVHSVARFLSAKVSKAVDFNAKNTGSYTFDNPLVAAYLADKLQAEVEAYENWSYGDIESDAIDVPNTTAIPADLDLVACVGDRIDASMLVLRSRTASRRALSMRCANTDAKVGDSL